NHDGSAGKMEIDGIIEMFQQSLDKHDVRYAIYIGDADTKTYISLLEASPYNDKFIVKKRECILHVKRKMYRRVKEAKKQLTQMKKAQKQQEIMQDLSLYYGLAIHRHPDSVEDMCNEIWATYYHKISTD
ncbi:hypothetical protein EAI_16762, partial [Harpegnathos saltator]